LSSHCNIGDDAFVVRSFIAAVAEDGSLADPALGELDQIASCHFVLSSSTHDSSCVFSVTISGNVTLKGGDDGDDSFIISDSTAVSLANSDDGGRRLEEEVPPDYIGNSLVDVDGGTGTILLSYQRIGYFTIYLHIILLQFFGASGSNNLTIVGTEVADRYVVQAGKVFGGGLSVK
jgi:hypothetical protein